MDWNKMVKMTVPVGLCGWQQRGSLTINGRTKEFPVGVETELPEPVAERIKALMADAAEKAEHVQPLKPWMQYVTGADGLARWEPRLAYAETEEVVILPEKTIPINHDENLVQGQFAEPLSEGNEYTVNYNGTAYMCVAQTFDRGDGVKNIALGNIGALVGGDDTGEPFALIAFPPAMAIEFSASLITFDGAESVTLSITGVAEKIKPLDPKYLPSGSGGGGVMWITAQAVPSGSDLDVIDQIQNPSHTYADVKTAVDAGRFCVLKLEFPDGTIFYMPISATMQAGMDTAVIAFTGLIPGMQKNVMVNEAGWIISNQ